MTISFVGIGGQAAGVSSVTPAYPAGVAAGQLAVLQVVSGHPDDSIPSTPSGWQLVGSFSGGGGTFGASAGPRRLTWFTRELAGSDAAPTTTLPSGSGSVISGRISVLSRSAGTGWRWAATFGEDTASDTGYSASCPTAITFAVGDFVVLGYGLNSDSLGVSSEAVTATGITFGTFTERADLGTSGTGDGAWNASATSTVTAGTGTEAPTVTATLGAAATGAAGVLRIREASSDITASPQTAFPPRNIVSVSGMKADDIITATVYRQYGTALATVRGGGVVDVSGTDALVRIDAEQPYGVSVNYAADLVDSNGLTWTVYSGPITSTTTSDVISDAIRGAGAHIEIEDWADKKRTRETAQFNVNGRIIVVGKPRSRAQATVTVSTSNDDDGDALQDILDNATNGIIQVRGQTTLPGADNYLILLDDDERRQWTIPYRTWDLDTVECDPWPDSLEAAGFTLQDIANAFPDGSLQDIADFFPSGTLLDIALYDWG